MEAINFLFVSKDSLSGDLAWKLIREGHNVRFYFQDRHSKDVYNGFIKKIKDWKAYKKWADVIIFDDENFGKYANELRRRGKLVIGGSIYTDKLETSRRFGQNELAKYGIKTLPGRQFNNYEKAIRFVKRKPGRYVFKPSGHSQSGDKRLIMVSQAKDGRDIIEFLKQNKDVWYKKAPTFLLQKFVNGVEIAVGAFFNGNEFIHPININFEHKRLFHGNVGPMTGEAGTLMYWKNSNKIFKATLAKMLPALRKSKYIGYIDINCIVNGRGIYPLEFTSRFGYPTIQIQLEGIINKTGDWLRRLAKGEHFKLKIKKGFQVGVVIFTPPVLSEGDDKETVNTYRDLAINFKDKTKLRGVHLGDVKNDEGTWRIAGISGWNLVVAGHGKTVGQARSLVYNRIKNIQIPNMFYRGDIGSNWTIQRKKLRKWGYI